MPGSWPGSARAEGVPDRRLHLTHRPVVREALPRDAATRNVEAEALERVPEGAEESLPLPRADPEEREVGAGGDGTPACDLPDDVENELADFCLFHEVPR